MKKLILIVLAAAGTLSVRAGGYCGFGWGWGFYPSISFSVGIPLYSSYSQVYYVSPYGCAFVSPAPLAPPVSRPVPAEPPATPAKVSEAVPVEKAIPAADSQANDPMADANRLFGR